MLKNGCRVVVVSVFVLAVGIVGCSASRVAKAGTKATVVASPAAPKASFLWAASVRENVLGTGEASQHSPETMTRIVGLRVAPDKSVWAATATGKFIIFNPDGKRLAVWGRGGRGPGEFSFAFAPNNMTAHLFFFPDGSFWVADTFNARIQRFGADRRLVGQFGSGDGIASAPMAMDQAANGDVYVIFRMRSELQRFGPKGDFRGMTDLKLRQPTGLSIDEVGRFWIVDCNYKDGPDPEDPEVKVFTSDLKPILDFGKPGPDFDGMRLPGDIAVDGQGHVFVADNYHHRGIVFDRGGGYIMTIGGRGAGDGQFNYAQGLDLDGQGGVYLGDWTGGRLEKFAIEGLTAAP